MNHTTEAPANEYRDRFPDHLFIQVYPARLRALFRRAAAAAKAKGIKFTRAMMLEIILLGLRIDENDQCWPSASDNAESVGMTSKSAVKRLHNTLRLIGVLDWERDPNLPTRRYTLKHGGAFYFGNDSYQKGAKKMGGDPTATRGGDPTATRGGDPTATRGGDPTAIPNKSQNLLNEKTYRTKSQTGQLTPTLRDAVMALGGETVPTFPQKTEDQVMTAARTLMGKGVAARESVLIAQQYSDEDIAAALDGMTKQRPYNPGGWLRRAIEAIGRHPIQYPPTNGPDDLAVGMLVKRLQAAPPATPADAFLQQDARLRAATTPPPPALDPKENLAAQLVTRYGMDRFRAVLISQQYQHATIRNAISTMPRPANNRVGSEAIINQLQMITGKPLNDPAPGSPEYAAVKAVADTLPGGPVQSGRVTQQ